MKYFTEYENINEIKKHLSKKIELFKNLKNDLDIILIKNIFFNQQKNKIFKQKEDINYFTRDILGTEKKNIFKINRKKIFLSEIKNDKVSDIEDQNENFTNEKFLREKINLKCKCDQFQCGIISNMIQKNSKKKNKTKSKYNKVKIHSSNLELNYFEYLLINFIPAIKNLTEKIEIALNQPISQSEKALSNILESNGIFSLFDEIRQVVISNSTIKEKMKSFEKMIQNFENTNTSIFRLKKFQIILQKDPFEIVEKEWFLDFIEKMLFYLQNLVLQAEKCLKIEKNEENYILLNLQTLYIDFYNSIQQSYNSYWGEILNLFLQKIDFFFFEDKKGSLNIFKGILNDLLVSFPKKINENNLSTKIKILKKGSFFSIKNKESKLNLSNESSRQFDNSNCFNLSQNYLDKDLNDFLNINLTHDIKELAKVLKKTNFQIKILQKKLFFENIERLILFKIPINQNFISQVKKLIHLNFEKNEFSLLGKKNMIDFPEIKINLKKVNNDQTKTLFYSEKKINLFENLIPHESIFFREWEWKNWNNDLIIFKFNFTKIYFKNKELNIELYTSNYKNGNIFQKEEITTLNASLNLENMIPLNYEDILSVLEENQDNFKKPDTNFISGWIDYNNVFPVKNEQVENLFFINKENSLNSFCIKLCQLPQKCYFKEKIEINENQKFSMIIFRFEDATSILQKLIDFKPNSENYINSYNSQNLSESKFKNENYEIKNESSFSNDLGFILQILEEKGINIESNQNHQIEKFFKEKHFMNTDGLFIFFIVPESILSSEVESSESFKYHLTEIKSKIKNDYSSSFITQKISSIKDLEEMHERKKIFPNKEMFKPIFLNKESENIVIAPFFDIFDSTMYTKLKNDGIKMIKKFD